jgi:iron complex transport system ATP-binding protein
MPELAVDRLCVALGGRPVVRGASWRMRGGELVALLGANGAGKTTALRAVLGLASRSGGKVRVGGDDPARMPPSERARRIAYLPQIRPLAWPVRVRDVVALGRFAHGATLGRLGPADQQAVAHAVRACDLERFVERPCSTLSGGELARVHVARALAADAPFLLADEPTAALDPLHQYQVMQLLRAGADAGRGVLVVMHDAALAAGVADRLLWMADGRIVADGSPEATLTPARLAEVYGVESVVRRIERDWLVSISGVAANGG